MIARAYVDGFNLYYGCIRGTRYHWLDLSTMFRLLLPNFQITKIHYFTAIVAGRPEDPDKPMRQQAYLRALKTLPNVEITLGHFLTHHVRMRLVNPLPGQDNTALVLKTEEKGSDVNLASYLVHDGHLNRFDTAVVLSNDSDLLTPIRIVRRELGKKVGIINPNRLHPSKVLAAECDFIKQIRRGVLERSQFPRSLIDAAGRFENPFQ